MSYENVCSFNNLDFTVAKSIQTRDLDLFLSFCSQICALPLLWFIFARYSIFHVTWYFLATCTWDRAPAWNFNLLKYKFTWSPSTSHGYGLWCSWVKGSSCFVARSATDVSPFSISCTLRARTRKILTIQNPFLLFLTKKKLCGRLWCQHVSSPKMWIVKGLWPLVLAELKFI